jgi:pentatricopeptide repeat protein
MTSVVVAYAKTGDPLNAEKVIEEMRDEMGL